MKWNLAIRKSCLSVLIMLLLVGNATEAAVVKSITLEPYIGAEYQYQHIKPNINYHPIISANFETGAAFIGTKFSKHLGAELGYYKSLKASQQQALISGFGNFSDIAFTEVLSRTHIKGFTADLDIYYALDAKFNIYAVLGFATMHPTISIHATTPAGQTFTESFLQDALPTIKGKNTTVPRLGMGVEYIEQLWGIRMRVLWLNTQKLRYNVAVAQADVGNAIGPRPYLQSIQVTAGIFFRF